MEYIARTYRKQFSRDRWEAFAVRYKETDLWIGVDKASFRKEMLSFTEHYVRELRREMDAWITAHPDYARALVPYAAGPTAPAIFRDMSAAARQSGIGPMSAVAGAVARQIGRALQSRFHPREVIVENGGDIYAAIRDDLDISVFAGTSPLSGKVGLHITAGDAPLGICTSSGTVGPSLSFGKADAVMIVCRDPLLADTYATAFANLIRKPGDIPDCIGKIQEEKDILAAIAIKDDRMGICGKYELRLF